MAIKRPLSFFLSRYKQGYNVGAKVPTDGILLSFFFLSMPPPPLPTPLLGILSSTYETPTKPPTMFSFMEFHRFSLVSRYTGRASSSIVPGEQRNMLLPPASNIDIVPLNSKHKNAITHIESACMRYFSSFGFTLSRFSGPFVYLYYTPSIFYLSRPDIH